MIKETNVDSQKVENKMSSVSFSDKASEDLSNKFSHVSKEKPLFNQVAWVQLDLKGQPPQEEQRVHFERIDDHKKAVLQAAEFVGDLCVEDESDSNLIGATVSFEGHNTEFYVQLEIKQKT